MNQSFEGITPNDVTLFYSPTCGYCYRVLAALDGMGLKIATENTRSNPAARTELYKGGGKTQVPALRINTSDGKTHWMYESFDIIEFLESTFAAP